MPSKNSLLVEDFNLVHTLDSGQFFRYFQKKHGFEVFSMDKRFFVDQKENKLNFEGVDAKFIKNFFSLDEPYAEIKSYLAKDRFIAQALKHYSGLRLIRQDPWQCLVGFICSSASNIPKIKKNVELISQNFGKRMAGGWFAFPEPGKLNDLQTLKDCATGFRAKYLFETNQVISNGFFKELKELSYEEAKLKLIELPGVGEKIADCVLLFAYGFQEAFPVDVWMKRVIEELYFSNKKITPQQVAEFGRRRFRPYAGYAQQYLYHWRRNL